MLYFTKVDDGLRMAVSADRIIALAQKADGTTVIMIETKTGNLSYTAKESFNDIVEVHTK